MGYWLSLSINIEQETGAGMFSHKFYRTNGQGFPAGALLFWRKLSFFYTMLLFAH